MKVIQDINELPNVCSHACVTIGNFDGVHKGHLQLLQKVAEEARKCNGTSIAITFDPHPMQVLSPEGVRQITSWQQKQELIGKTGIDFLLVIPFTKEFAETSPEDFVQQVVVEVRTVKLIIGYDYAFGKGRKGDGAFLRRIGEKYGFSVEIVPPFYHGDKLVSSSLIREMVMQGEMLSAAEFLGRPYQIQGEVKPGKQRGGDEVGFATANLRLNEGSLIPKYGVYVSRVKYAGKVYGGVLNIGINPTFDEKELVAETHIFDFDKNIYGQEIQVSLLKYLRGEKRFASIDELTAQIEKDVTTAKGFLADYSR